ncbi:MAG: PD-(D/E)XK nuclease family protein [Proteobacteria bacterium]|nr:PD-(D/E)XK nuclease family protein [Pseudomonadota bacterium]
MVADKLYSFLSDPELTELVEQVKITDDILDVITLSENQHSDMLAWCLTPGEGHGQGDAVIKDFLEAAYRESSKTTFDNKKFFKKWTPGRIRVSSFGAAFVTREFSVKIKYPGHDEKRPGRIDLFIVDPQNKLLIAIENKVGAKLTESQLDDYRSAVNSEIGCRQIFRNYEFAYIVLDRELSWYTDAQLNELGKRWVFLDYTWLEASAQRARLQLARNNQAVQLLVAYCQKQTDWESSSEARLSELVSEVASRHPYVITALRALRGQGVPKWTPTTLEGISGELTLFYVQNLRVCKLLMRSQGIALLQRKITQALGLRPNDMLGGRTKFNFVTSEMAKLSVDGDSLWALSINVYRQPKSDDDKPLYTLRVVWRREAFDDDGDADVVRRHLTKQLPDLKRFDSAAVRRIIVNRDLDADAVLEQGVALAKQLSASLTSWRKT